MNDTFYKKPSPTKANIEGTPLFVFLRKKVSAGMTVEAAMVLPLFLFFFLNLSCALEMIRLQSNLELALRETGSSFSIYGAVLLAEQSPRQQSGGNIGIFAEQSPRQQSGGNIGIFAEQSPRQQAGGNIGIFAEIGDMVLSSLYAKRAVVKYVGEDYLKQSPLTKGAEGLQFIESEIFTSGDCFELIMTYEVSTWAKMPGIRPFRMWNRYYGHFWNGYGIPDDAGVTVYVTENGSVYHEKRECTYLVLTVREVAGRQVENERSENGNKYYLCEKCGEGAMPATVFVGAEGERFHYSRDCSGLKRTVFSIFLKEADAYRPCSRCSGGR